MRSSHLFFPKDTSARPREQGEPTAVCVRFHVSDFCSYSHPHPLCKGFAGAMLSLRGLHPPRHPSGPGRVILPCRHHCRALEATPARPVLSGPFVPISGKRYRVRVGQNAQAPHCRQHKAEILGTRPLTHLCSLGLCPKAGMAAFVGLFFCVYFFTCMKLTSSQTPSPPKPMPPTTHPHPCEAPRPDPGVPLMWWKRRGKPPKCVKLPRPSWLGAPDTD